MRKLSFILLVGIFTLSSCSFGSQEYEPQEYISTTGSAAPGTETKIELEDGASIVIPANAIDDDIAVKVERNPEKSNNLPPLDENLVAVSDFYNFEIDGTINGPVDLVLPFDPELVPENEAGILVAAIPTENGWKYIPVIPDGNKVTLYTDQVGDPLIAWHFACTDRNDLSYEGQPDTTCEDQEAKLRVCDPDIAMDIVQNGDRFDVVGYVLPVAKNFFGGTISEPASNIDVEIRVNAGWRGPGQSFNVTTNETGSFSFTVDQDKGLAEGWNWVFAKATCDPWWGRIVVESNGYTEFKYVPAVVEQPASTAIPESTQTPIAEQIAKAPIPAGAVLLPDFIGQNIDDAIDWLETNGFKYTWVDGSSPYELGTVFRQAPFGNQYKVPHRTVVVLHRTAEKITNPCVILNLTNEECINIDKHTYQYNINEVFKQIPDYASDGYSCGPYSDTNQIRIEFLDNGLLLLDGNIAGPDVYEWVKVGTNTYHPVETLERDDYILIFQENGFIINHRWYPNSRDYPLFCDSVGEYILQQ